MLGWAIFLAGHLMETRLRGNQRSNGILRFKESGGHYFDQCSGCIDNSGCNQLPLLAGNPNRDIPVFIVIAPMSCCEPEAYRLTPSNIVWLM